MTTLYRHPTLIQLFALIVARESCAVVGVPGIGKSRLLRHAAKTEVASQYMPDLLDLPDATNTLVVYCDFNKLGTDAGDHVEKAVCELTLTALIDTCSQHVTAHLLRDRLVTLRDAANGAFNRRHIEAAAQVVCGERAIYLCLIFDAFDTTLRALSAQTLIGFRAIRDDYKEHLSYVLGLGKHPAQVRPPSEYEPFYTLFARSIIGLPAYSKADSRDMIADIQSRRRFALDEAAIEQIIAQSGGHSGLIVAMCDVLAKQSSLAFDDWAGHDAVVGASKKIWDALSPSEQSALSQVAFGQSPVDTEAVSLLQLKSLLDGRLTIFAPAFTHFVRHFGTLAGQSFSLDAKAHIAWIGDKPITDLTAMEFRLLEFLAKHANQVVDRKTILQALNPDAEYTVSLDNSVDAQIKRIRKKIEPALRHPRYLVNVRGKGYKLMTHQKNNL